MLIKVVPDWSDCRLSETELKELFEILRKRYPDTIDKDADSFSFREITKALANLEHRAYLEQDEMRLEGFLYWLSRVIDNSVIKVDLQDVEAAGTD